MLTCWCVCVCVHDGVRQLEPGEALCAGHWCRACLGHYALGGPVVLLASFLSGGLLFPLLPVLTCSRFEWMIQSRTRAAIRRKYNLPVRCNPPSVCAAPSHGFRCRHTASRRLHPSPSQALEFRSRRYLSVR